MMTYGKPNVQCYFGSNGIDFETCYLSTRSFTAAELNSHTMQVCGHEISEFTLIKSRYVHLPENSIICDEHRRMFCENYIPTQRCSYAECCETDQLMRIGVGAADFIRNVPIRKYIDTTIHRRY